MEAQPPAITTRRSAEAVPGRGSAGVRRERLDETRSASTQRRFTRRPTRRLRLMIARPLDVDIRARNPTLRILLIRLSLCG